MKILLIGYGNPGRQDDGIGVFVANEIEKAGITGLTIETDYQLNIEYVPAVADADLAIFVDADTSAREPFEFRKIEPSDKITFTTHSIKPEGLLALSHDMFGHLTDSYMIGVKGYEFEIAEGLSEKVVENASKAISFIMEFIEDQKKYDGLKHNE
jgi:hydrogenase maturation protease